MAAGRVQPARPDEDQGHAKTGSTERKGINPFTKEETVFKAKPAQNVVKIVPLKGLKDSV